MSEAVTERIDALLRRAVETEAIPGAIAWVRQGGRVVYQGAHGVSDRQLRAPLAADSVLWLASLTKPIVASAVLMLRDEGRLRLDDPLSRFIPEFARPRTVRMWKTPEGQPQGTLPAIAPGPGQADPPHELAPAGRELTVFDLLTHTGGLQTITIPNRRIPPVPPDATLASYIPRLADVPLDFEPGTRWAYSNAVSYEVLGYIVELVSGERLPEFLQKRVFAPLGLHDTGFGLLGKHPRAVPVDPRFAAAPAIAAVSYFSGAAGLWGTLSDYGAFAEMLLRGGESHGVQVLAPGSVQEMTSNQVGELLPGLNGRRPAPGLGFGLGVGCVLDPVRSGIGLPGGSFGWDGIGSRRFWAVPQADLVLAMYVPDPRLQAEVEQLCGELVADAQPRR